MFVGIGNMELPLHKPGRYTDQQNYLLGSGGGILMHGNKKASVFVSYSFKDEGQYYNIADQLEAARISYWCQNDMNPGTSLADQLRELICNSAVCIFVATHNSVESAWCGAELGAFWGAGKPVVIYISDSNLESDKLPRQFQGHLLERRIRKVVEAVQRHLSEIAHDASVTKQRKLVSDLDIDEFEALIERAARRPINLAHASSTLRELAGIAANLLVDSAILRLDPHLRDLLGLPFEIVRDVAPEKWPFRVQGFATTTGEWRGYALKHETLVYVDVWYPCLMFRSNAEDRVEAVAVLTEVQDPDRESYLVVGDPVIVVGRSEFGDLQPPARSQRSVWPDS